MIHRTFDVISLIDDLMPYADDLRLFDPYGWLENDKNIAVTNGKGSYGLLNYEEEGTYTGHHFHPLGVRGREALSISKEMLAFLFTFPEVRIMRGLTPLDKKEARWAARQLGFTSLGVLPSLDRPCELFILHRSE